MFLSFNEEAQKMLLLSLKEKNKLNDTHIGSEHIILSLLTMKNNSICKIFNECGVYYNNFFSVQKKKDNLINDNYYLFTPLINDIFLKLSKVKKDEVTIKDIIIELLSNNNSKVVYMLKILKVDIASLIKKININNRIKKKNNKTILKDLGVILNDLDNDFNIIEREDEIKEILEILCCRNKNNPILIGEAGVGKTAVVEELAKRINKGLVPNNLINKKIYSLSMSSLVAGTKYRGEFEEKINKLIEEVEEDEDIILFIDEIHTLVGAGGADGAIDASNILKPALARGKIKLIGATTTDEYNKYILNDKALNRRFKKVNIEEPSKEKVRKILLGIKPFYEKYHNVIINDSLIDKIIYFCDNYLKNKKYPDKAIDILDEVCVLSLFEDNTNVLNNTDKEINKVIRLKNESLIIKDYKSAIKYSHAEKRLYSELSKYNKKSIRRKNNIKVLDKYLLKIMERKVNIPFYSIKYDNNVIKDRIDKFKNITFFDDEVYDRIKNITNEVYFNLTNNCLYNEINFYSEIDTKYIDTYIDCFFQNIDVINLDISNYRCIDELLSDNLLDKIKKYRFFVMNISNFDICDNSIKCFLEEIKKNGYYVDKNHKKYSFNKGLFIFNNKVEKQGLGFNNNKLNLLDNSIIIRGYSSKKIKDKIKDICIKKELSYDNDFITKVLMEVEKNNNVDRIDYYIIKLMKKNVIETNKNRTIKV